MMERSKDRPAQCTIIKLITTHEIGLIGTALHVYEMPLTHFVIRNCMLSLCRTSLSLAYVHRIAVSMFEDILVGLTNTVSVSEARIQITLLIVRQSA